MEIPVLFEKEPILVGDLRARYLKTRQGRRLRGHVLRFVGLDETQLELLDGLPTSFPVVDGDEESAVPLGRPGDPDAEAA